MCQNTKMWQITVNKLSKNCQKPKCNKFVSKIVQKCIQNLTKYKNVFKIGQKWFSKCVKIVTKQKVLLVFCHIFVG